MSPLGRGPSKRARGGLPAPPVPRPSAGESVTLGLAGRGRYGGRIVQVDQDELLVVLLFEAREPLQVGQQEAMEIEFTVQQGLVRLAGSGRVEAHDLVRFQMDGAVQVEQRRDFVRVRAVRPMALAPVLDDDTTGEWIDTLTVNVSGNGLLAAGPDTLGLETRVRFHLKLVEGEPPIEGAGVVARITDAGERGIAIRELTADDRKRLVHFIFERERIARRLMRDGEL